MSIFQQGQRKHHGCSLHHAHRAQHVVGSVARSLRFAPQLERLAERIVANMTQSGHLVFNAAHLRIEKDARDWSIILGGEGVCSNSTEPLAKRQAFCGIAVPILTAVLHAQVVWDRYVRAMQEANFSASVGMYVASGLLTYGASQGEDAPGYGAETACRQRQCSACGTAGAEPAFGT